MLVVLLFALFFRHEPDYQLTTILNQEIQIPATNSFLPFGSEIQEIVLGMPISWSATTTKARGVMFLFHGCNHDARDWFSLPEEVQFTKEALKQGFHVIAFSSVQRSGAKCWNTNVPNSFPDENPHNDLHRVERVAKLIINREHWSDLPTVAVGVSSGGVFASIFAVQWNPHQLFRAILLIISPIHPAILADLPQDYPKAIGYIEMSKDTRTSSFVSDQQNLLIQQGFSVEIWSVTPLPVSVDEFVTKLGLNYSEATELVELFQKENLIGEFSLLKEDPRQSAKWVHLLNDHPTLGFLIKPRYREMEEVMNVFWGAHEMTSESSDLAIDWISSNL